jgi:hypothetical protein
MQIIQTPLQRSPLDLILRRNIQDCKPISGRDIKEGKGGGGNGKPDATGMKKNGFRYKC